MAEQEITGAELAVQGPDGMEVPCQTGSVRTLAAIGAEIREHAARMEYHKRGTLWEAVEIGRRLQEARDAAAHGEWADFLARETGYTPRTASNFMRVFDGYKDHQNELFQNEPEANRKTFSDLSYMQALTLLALPEGEREQFLEQNDVEDMTVRELKEAVRREREARDAAEQERDEAQADAARADESAKILNNGLERERKAREEAERALNQEREGSSGTALRIAELEEKLEDAEARREDMAEKLEQAKADAAHAEQSRAEMERSLQMLQGVHDGTVAELDELKKKPIDVAVEPVPDQEAIDAARAEARAEATAEVQKQYEADMADLRRQLEEVQAAKGTPKDAPADKDLAAFEILFNQAQGTINQLHGIVMKISGRGDTDTAGKLRNALTALSEAVARVAKGEAA